MVGGMTSRNSGLPSLATQLSLRYCPSAGGIRLPECKSSASVLEPHSPSLCPILSKDRGQQQSNFSGLLGGMRSYTQRAVQGLAH